MARHFFWTLILAHLLALATSGARADDGRFQLGMNLAAPVYYTAEWDFVDVMKHSRVWESGSARPGGGFEKATVEVDEFGWPILKTGQTASTLMCRETDGHYPAGDYVCTYDGRGDVTVGFDAVPVKKLPNRIVMRVKPTSAGIVLRVLRSDPADRVRNIRVWMPGLENAKSPFHPLFVQRLRPFKVIRFMDWGYVNNSPITKWSERNRVESVRQTAPAGVAVEYMVDLCNELGSDPWFCMPHLADEEFVREFAKLVKSRLRPDLKIYVEWSNEAWNFMFQQTHWAAQQAKARGLNQQAVVADEAARDWRIWREVFGDQAAARVVRVAAGQHYNPAVVRKMLDRLNGEFDAIACGAYLYPRPDDVKSFTAATTSANLIRSCIANFRETGLPHLSEHKAIADEWSRKLGRHVPLLVYEGGQHLTAMGKELPYARSLIDAQHDPAMHDAYVELLKGFKDLGGDVFVAFSYVCQETKWGSWGHLKYQDEPLSEAVKYRALLEFGRQTETEGAVPGGRRQ